MISFHWKRGSDRHGTQWTLFLGPKLLGQAFYLPDSKRYRAGASAPTKGGVVFTEYQAGTMKAAMDSLERDWSKRSIGLFGEDDIEFRRITRKRASLSTVIRGSYARLSQKT